MNYLKNIIFVVMTSVMLSGCVYSWNSMSDFRWDLRKVNYKNEPVEFLELSDFLDHTGFVHFLFYSRVDLGQKSPWDRVVYRGWVKDGEPHGFGEFTFTEDHKRNYLIDNLANSRTSFNYKKNGSTKGYDKLIKSNHWYDGYLVVRGIFSNGEFIKPCYGDCYQKNYIDRRIKEIGKETVLKEETYLNQISMERQIKQKKYDEINRANEIRIQRENEIYAQKEKIRIQKLLKQVRKVYSNYINSLYVGGKVRMRGKEYLILGFKPNLIAIQKYSDNYYSYGIPITEWVPLSAATIKVRFTDGDTADLIDIINNNSVHVWMDSSYKEEKTFSLNSVDYFYY